MKKSYFVLALLALVALLLAACGGTPTAPAGRWPTPGEQSAQTPQPDSPLRPGRPRPPSRSPRPNPCCTERQSLAVDQDHLQ